MKRFALASLLLCLLPQIALAQGFGVGARAGTLGIGGEGALALSDQLVIRGGLGSFFFEFDGEMDGIDYTVTPPSFTGTLGVDFYPTGGAFRLMAGLMFRNGDFELESGDISQAGGVEIGDEEYYDEGYLFGTVSSSSAAPFVGFGFGKHTSGGFGVFFDLGLAFVGDPDVSMRATGPIASVEGFQDELDKEVQQIEDDATPYLKYWPILNFGLKFPIR
jgi:hypothetical protein